MKYISREEHIQMLREEESPRTTLSFYKYTKIEDLKEFREKLYSGFKKLNCRGRIYVANEGINAQMNVPSENFNKLDEFIQSIEELKGVEYKLALEEKNNSSFIKLFVRIRDNIVADGIADKTFDSTNTGKYVDAEEMNKHIEKGGLVIDMRNNYETAIGHFKGSMQMNVSSFKEQLKNLKKQFKGKEDEEIIIYCTGGIRCEKASAWMKHLGFKNVKHVKGGIIDYVKQVKENNLTNYFKGKNFVFDERMGERVTDDVLTTCCTCKNTKTDLYRNCINQTCNKLYICCDSCFKENKHCSKPCKIIDKFPLRIKELLIQPKGKNGKFNKRWMV